MEASEKGEGWMKVGRVSPLSGRTNFMDLQLGMDQLEAFAEGKGGFIQELFPALSADEREFLLTGLTKEDWNSLFDSPE